MMIDLRSDTVTRPTAEMRRVMAEASVGDDVFGDDPTVRALEDRTAEILGKPAAVYMPSGTMTNQVAIRTHTEPGDEVFLDENAHVYLLEGGAPGAISGVVVRTLPGVRGVFGAADVRVRLRVPHPSIPRTLAAPSKLLCIENTHNLGGGNVWSKEQIESVASVARAAGMALHLDGARLWHATVATGVSEAEYAAPFDTVSVCFSKGLGAPIGSALAGSEALIARARRFRTQLGGGMRQAGIIAAAALHALEHHRGHLHEDHAHARLFAEGIARIEGISVDLAAVRTNIVRFDVSTMSAAEAATRLHAQGLFVLPAGERTIRAVTHRDVGRAEVLEAIEIVRRAVGGAATEAGA